MYNSLPKTLFFILLAVVLITLFRCCSWLNPSQLHDDVNVFICTSKSLLSGKLLYTELPLHKGLLHYFLFVCVAAFSSKTFFAIYLIEILCCFGYLSVSYRLMHMFANKSISIVMTSVVGILTYTSVFMIFRGIVEELTLPIILYILYKTLRYAKFGELPNKVESTLIGVGIATIFWMKFTVLATCIGALAAIFILSWRREQTTLLLRCLAWSLIGTLGLSACVLLYFIVYGNIADLYHSYLYFNIFKYAEFGLLDTLWCFYLIPLKWTIWSMLVGVVLLLRISNDVKLIVTFCWGAQLLFFVLFRIHLHYISSVFVFAPLLIYFVKDLYIKNLIARLYSRFRTLILYGIIGTCMSILDFSFFTGLTKWTSIHYIIANIISYSTGTLCSFLLNCKYNFKVTDHIMRRMAIFFGVGAIGMFLSSVTLHFCVDNLQWTESISKLTSIVFVAIIQFLLNKYISFWKGKKATESTVK